MTGASQSLPPCTATGYSANDVWYKFVATGTTHSITLTPTSFTDFMMQVYSGSCSSLTSIACIDNTIISEIEGGTLTNLTPGVTYYVRVFSKYAWTDMQFQLCVNSNFIPIPNDEVTGAIVRSTTGSPDYSHFSNIGATLSLAACTLNANNDIWFKFVATSSRHIIRYNTAGYNDYATAAQVFSGTPSNLTPVKCYGLSDNALDATGLTPGTTYYYRIYISTGNAIKTDFYTFLTTPPLPVIFVSFTGESINGTNQLIWEVTDEVNVSGYEVQSSVDGITFNKVDFIDARSNGRSSNVYTLRHTPNGTNGNKLYYRLKEIDKDGKSVFSAVIKLATKQLPNTSVFPNPVTNRVYIKTQGPKVFTFSITDVYGRTCLTGKTTGNSIETSRLAPGAYYLTLTDNDTQVKKTFILQKAAY